MVNLTNGALLAILDDKRPAVDKPILQVLNLKKIQTQGSNPERYRLQISDGTHFQPCMVAPQLNPLIHSEQMHKYCVLQMDKYICNIIHGRKIIILIQTTIVNTAQEVGGGPLGKPELLNLITTDDNSSGQGGGFKGQTGGPPPPQRDNRPNKPAINGGSSAGAYHNAAPPSRPAFGGPSVMTSPGGTPLSSRGIIPITGLNPYQNKWTIKARVSSKPAIRTWSNSRGEGRVFNVDLVDSSGDVRACAFHEMADKMHSTFELGKVYYVSRGRLKPANRSFNTTSCEYEITLNEDSEVETCTEVDDSLPTITYNFVTIDKLQGIEPNSMIDVIGVCRETDSLHNLISKSNKKLTKRDIQLVDRSNHIVKCTLWGAEAEGFSEEQTFPVIAIKGARVSDFGGRTLNIGYNSVMTINPDIPEAHQLRGWFDNFGKNVEATSISDARGGGAMQTSFLTLGQVKELNLGQKEKPDYFSVTASVIFARKENCLYKACPTEECNKKVTEDNMGGYFCEKCNRSFDKFKYRMILMINTSDHSDSQWMTCFQDTGSEILRKSAQELGELRESDENTFDSLFQEANFKEYVFRTRAKMDTYNDEQRLKCYCVGVAPVNHVQETKRNIELIKEMM